MCECVCSTYVGCKQLPFRFWEREMICRIILSMFIFFFSPGDAKLTKNDFMCEHIQSKGLRPKLQIFHTYDKQSQRQNILKQMENGENALHPYFMYIQLSERNDEMSTAWSQNRKQFPFGKWRRKKMLSLIIFGAVFTLVQLGSIEFALHLRHLEAVPYQSHENSTPTPKYIINLLNRRLARRKH